MSSSSADTASLAKLPTLDGRSRIFYFVDSLNIGGTEIQTVEVSSRIDRTRYELVLGCLRKKGPLLERAEAAGVRIVEFDPGGGILTLKGLRQLIRLVGYLRREKFDIIHTQDLWTNLMGVPAARLAGTPVVISSRRDLANWWWYTPRKRKVLSFVQRFSTRIVANSVAIRDLLVKEEHVCPEKINVIKNAVDFERFAQAKAHRDQFFPGLDPASPVVLMVANMNGISKGHNHLFEAAPAIVGKFPNVAFALAGDGKDRPAFEARLDGLGLRDKFYFLGRTTEIPPLLRSAQVFTLPSDAEGLPNVVLEAMAAGLPVVASAVGGIKDIIKDGVTGLLIPPKDSAALANAIIRVLDEPILAERLGKNAQACAHDEFSFDRLLKELDLLYQELLEKSNSQETIRHRV